MTSVALLLALASSAGAADQTILGSQLRVKNPSTLYKRSVLVKAKEAASPDTIVGDPTAGGATLFVAADGGTPTSQTFSLPVGTSVLTGKPFWTGDAIKGFKYKDPKGENGPIKLAQLKKAGSGAFQIKAVALGKLGLIHVLPPNPGSGGCARLDIGGGDSYGIRFSDGTIVNYGALQFKVTKPTVEGLCTSSSTSTTTTTSSTSTTATTDPCTGVPVAGACWYLCEGGDSCTQCCAAEGLGYDTATETYAGSGGTNANCQSVFDALGVFPSATFELVCEDALECHRGPGGTIAFRCLNTPANPDAALTGAERVCACAGSPTSTTTTSTSTTTSSTTPPCTGASVGGACWYLSQLGESCTERCEAVGRAYDGATETYAGSGGTNDNCNAVLDALGVNPAPSFGFSEDDCPQPWECNYVLNPFGGPGDGRSRCTNTPADPDAAILYGYRACACAAYTCSAMNEAPQCDGTCPADFLCFGCSCASPFSAECDSCGGGCGPGGMGSCQFNPLDGNCNICVF